MSAITTNSSTPTIVYPITYTLINAGCPRLMNFSSIFVNIRFLSVRVQVRQLSAAQYALWAVIPRHLPYNPDSADAAVAAPSNPAVIKTMPGHGEAQQGWKYSPFTTTKLNDLQLKCSAFTTDAPTIFDLITYSATNCLWDIHILVEFSGFDDQ